MTTHKLKMSDHQKERRRVNLLAKLDRDNNNGIRVKKSSNLESRSCGIRGPLPRVIAGMSTNTCNSCGRLAFEHPRIELFPSILFPVYIDSQCPFYQIGEIQDSNPNNAEPQPKTLPLSRY